MEMSNRYRLVIFDVDGTMLDTSEGLIASAIYTIHQLGYELPTQDVLESFVGPRIQDSLSRVFGLEGEELSGAASIFRERYKQGDVLLAKPYEGIYEILGLLKQRDVHVAIATNKRQDFVDALVKKYDFEPFIEVVYGTDFQGKLKKSDLLHMCMDKLQITEPKEVVLVGDSDYDAEAAETVGIDFIGAIYGFDFKTKSDVDKWNNVGCISSLGELEQIIL